LVVDEDVQTVRVALGSVGPTMIRAREAEAFVADRLDWDEAAAGLHDDAIGRFAELVAGAAQPIDDVRGSAAYRRHACRVLAAQANGLEVRTVEALSAGGDLHPVQDAFLETGAVQCGFCTPGLIVAVADLLQWDPHPTEHVVREALSGNLCRCTGYQK